MQAMVPHDVHDAVSLAILVAQTREQRHAQVPAHLYMMKAVGNVVDRMHVGMVCMLGE
jgi:lipoprotein signal peptidase